MVGEFLLDAFIGDFLDAFCVEAGTHFHPVAEYFLVKPDFQFFDGVAMIVEHGCRLQVFQYRFLVVVKALHQSAEGGAVFFINYHGDIFECIFDAY